MDKITSIHNQRIKEVSKLYDRSARDASGLFLIEGIKELNCALEAKIKIDTLFYCPDILKDDLDISDTIETIEVNKAVFDKLTYRGSTGGLLAVARTPRKSLAELKLPNNSLVVVLEKMEKPGNIGAILRTADAAGVAAVIIADPSTDLYNPNTIRSSLGAIFTVPTLSVPQSAEVITWLKENKIQILAATPYGETMYDKVSSKTGLAVVIGSEKDGLKQRWIDAADHKVVIPMQGKIDSLNASVSAAILIYAYARFSHRS